MCPTSRCWTRRTSAWAAPCLPAPLLGRRGSDALPVLAPARLFLAAPDAQEAHARELPLHSGGRQLPQGARVEAERPHHRAAGHPREAARLRKCVPAPTHALDTLGRN